LDLCAALDVLNEANQFDQTPKYSWSLFSEDGNAVLASNGLSMNVDSPMMPISRRDTVIVLGGKEYLSASTLPVLAWLRSVSRQGARIGAIGSALFTLTKAGVHLNGPVSAHWAYREAIAEHYPDLELKHNIFCIGEKSLTCAGGAATLDMMLQLIALTSDSRIANWVADRLVCSSFRTGQEDQGAAEFVHMRKRDSKLEKAFEGNGKLQFHFAPPWLARRDSETGMPLKQNYGAWMLPILRQLARLRWLRGSRLDIFGYSEERKAERQLIEDYEQTINNLIRGLGPGNHQLAVEIASIPEMIRGYGHVKARNLVVAEARLTELKALWEQPLLETAVSHGVG
jgi:AraC family carnitine catabolism transcriptional activator